MRIGLLGTLTVHDEAGRPVRVGGQRVRMLLILLALDAGQVVPAYSLIERLWDDDPPANAGNSLQSLVSRLRTSLRQASLGGQVIESHPAGYRLAVSPRQVDAVAFEDLARQGSQALASGDAATARRALGEALDTWRGPALADAPGARFAAGPAARLEESRTRAALDLIEADLALGETDSLIGELRAMIAADPVAERPRGLLMRALYAAGRQAEALAVYRQTRDLLATELGVDPSPQLEQIHLGVLRQDLPGAAAAQPAAGAQAAAPLRVPPARQPAASELASPGPAGVRRPLTSFVGRDEDVARVQKMLAEGRLVTLTGPGGAGKTRLAIETAARLAAEAPMAAAVAGPGRARAGCEVWLVELTPVTNPGQIPYAVLHALGIRESPVLARHGASQPGAPADPAQWLVTALAERRGLLVLDNCEHVVAAAAAVADEILASCPDVRVLATSREPLRITGEVLWPVPPLPVPPAPAAPAGQKALDGMAPDRMAPVGTGAGGDPAGETGTTEVAGYASVRLLADRAAAVRPDFAVTPGNAADVARICRALDGMPLAIELAAARLRTLSAAQLAQRLDARFELLTGGSRTAVPRHQTLRAVVDWSWELLSEPEQMLARRLAAFGGGATLTAAEQVCQDAALPVGSVLPTMFGLVEKSFVAVDADDEPRYRMLETIQAYCLERLAEAGEEDRVRHTFARYFLHLAETADPMLRGAQQSAWMRRLTSEQDNIHAALRWAIRRRDAAMALRFGQALGWFWLLRGQRRENADLAREIMAISDPAEFPGAGRDVVEARAVCALTAVNASWDIAEVMQPLTAAETLLAPRPGADGTPEHPPHPLVVVGIAMLGLYVKRDPEAALAGLTPHFTSPDPWIRSGSRLMHTFFAMSLGQVEGAAGRCAEALAEFETIGDRWGMALALMGQAELALLDGDHARAIAVLERALELSREVMDWEDAAQMHATLAKSHSRVGDFSGALRDIAQAERIAQASGGHDSDLWISYIRAELAWLSGDLAETGRLCRRLDDRLAAKPAVMSWSFRALVLLRGALAEMRAGGAADGHAALATALRLAADSQDRAAVAAVMDGLAAAALWAGAGHARAEWAATMLGAAHSARGAFDHSSLDAPAARDTARHTLGGEAFEAAYRRGLALGYGQALTLAQDAAAEQIPR